MSVVRISKTFTFDMAHALEGYNGLCKNIHGHTYVLRVTVLGQPLTDNTHPENGLVMDFGDLKRIVNKVVLDKFDHALVIKEGSAILKSLDLSVNERLITTPFQPSCENLLLHYVELIQSMLPQQVKLVSARLNETPTSYAEWLLEDQ
ncbi:MAG: 6-carboxytetrahydropterin synthase [Crocinitomicaceae bacterium]|nr:6-carboxytetrahydropterin synthase [Crocinitomicaceae bacterium]